LRSVNIEELIPYGHLFHELQFKREGQKTAYGRAISNLLASCCNLRKLRHVGPDDELRWSDDEEYDNEQDSHSNPSILSAAGGAGVVFVDVR
jgi:hypothetical protein